MGCQGHPGEQAKEDWGSARDGQVGPLALGFHPQVSTDLLEGYLQLPAEYEPLDDMNWCYLRVGAQKSLGLEFRQRVANQDPAQGDWRQPSVVPDGSVRGHLQETLVAVIPGDDYLFPESFWFLETVVPGRQTCPLEARASGLARLARWGRLVEGGI
jgi:hypothetical protein